MFINNKKDISYKDDINNNLKNNLKYLIKKYNIDNETLAKCTGLSLATIASLRTRSNNPTVLTLQMLADFFNLTIDELINHDCSQFDTINSAIKKNIVVPIINLDMVSQWPINADRILSESNDVVTTTGNVSNFCYALRIDNEVLMPQYRKNTILIVDPNKKVADSNLVIVSFNCQKPTYRQVFIDADTLYFKPLNPDFGSMQYYKEYKVHGVIVRAIIDIN